MKIAIIDKASDLENIQTVTSCDVILDCGYSCLPDSKNVRVIEFDLSEFYRSGSLKKLVIFLRSFHRLYQRMIQICREFKAEHYDIYYCSDSVLFRLFLFVLNNNRKSTRLTCVYNYSLQHDAKSKARLGITKLCKNFDLPLLSVFLPSALLGWADEVITNKKSVKNYIKNNNFTAKVHFYNQQIVHLSGNNLETVTYGIFLSAWDYHGHPEIEKKQKQIVNKLICRMNELNITFFVRLHPKTLVHEWEEHAAYLSCGYSYVEDLTRCSHCLSIASSALEDASSYGSIPHKLLPEFGGDEYRVFNFNQFKLNNHIEQKN